MTTRSVPKPRDNLQQIGAGMGGPNSAKPPVVLFRLRTAIAERSVPRITSFGPHAARFLVLSIRHSGSNSPPAPNGPLPIPNTDIAPDATPGSPYLQQVSNVINGLNLNLGSRSRKRNDLVFTPRLDYQASSRGQLIPEFELQLFQLSRWRDHRSDRGNLWTANTGQRQCAYV